MTVPVVFHEELSPRLLATRTGAVPILIDLGFPCHLACVGCARRPPDPAAYHAAQRRLTFLAATCAKGVLRAVFFGGDAFALPRSFTAMLDETGEACARHGARFEGTVLSDGTAWSAEAVREFAYRGVPRYQVALDGPASIHDRLRPLRCSGGSFAKIMASLKFHRENADVVVRVNAAIGVSAIETLVEEMKEAGLLANPNPITVYVAPPACYRDQARSLLDLFTWRETQPGWAHDRPTFRARPG